MGVNYLTFEERKQIEDLLRKGATFPQMATLIGRSKNTIRSEIRKFGRSQYSAVKAHDHFESANVRRKKSLRKYIDANIKPFTPSIHKKRQEKISARLSLVEQKVEILLKIIKEGKNGIN